MLVCDQNSDAQIDICRALHFKNIGILCNFSELFAKETGVVAFV